MLPLILSGALVLLMALALGPIALYLGGALFGLGCLILALRIVGLLLG